MNAKGLARQVAELKATAGAAGRSLPKGCRTHAQWMDRLGKWRALWRSFFVERAIAEEEYKARTVDLGPLFPDGDGKPLVATAIELREAIREAVASERSAPHEPAMSEPVMATAFKRFQDAKDEPERKRQTDPQIAQQRFVAAVKDRLEGYRARHDTLDSAPDAYPDPD